MPDSTGNDYAAATLQCDIVMKGGITSGVVYPGAVVELARRYRFKSIGGTSAGAIAAAIVAAAEHARDRGGFTKVEALPGELAQTVDGRPFMLQLFQPDAATRPLFSALLGFLAGGPVRGSAATVAAFWRFPLLALAVAAISVGLSVFADADAAFAVAGVAAAVAILLAGLLGDVFRAATGLAANDFGLCRLGPETGSDGAPALTTWLHRRIQETAARPDGPVLTFADLWGVPAAHGDERRAALRRLSRHPERRAVDLQMMTTDLTHGRPWRLPVPLQAHRERLEEGGGLLFDAAELRRFFPEAVVAHLERLAEPLGAGTQEHLARVAPGRAFHHVPIGPDLPVVVATRMSLSFPVLISAVPLYELDFRSDPDSPPLRRVVFSDGGITSNFPVHFFDGPLPTRPTFGLHLTGFPPGEQPDPQDPCAAVKRPPAVNAEAFEEATEFTTLLGFFTAIKDAMQNWRDNAQARLPGFRERVAHIRLDRHEGGLNLAMRREKILELNARGACAGRQLVELFAGDGAPGSPPPEHWNDHRFARYRTTMSLLERLFRGLHRGYHAPPDPVTTPYVERIAQGANPPYAFRAQRRLEFAQATTEAYLALVDRWAGDTLDDENIPRPPSTLRAVPPV